MDPEILKKVIEMAAEQVGVDPKQVTAETHFHHDLEYDSLDDVDFAMKVEDEFELHVADEDAAQLKTVGDVVRYIAEHRQPKPAAT